MDTDKAVAWLESHWGTDWACPMCHGTDWTVNENMGVVLGTIDADKKVDFTKGIPVIAASCNSCGFIVQVNAVTAGLIH